MPITTTRFTENNGHTYPFLLVNLSISPKVLDGIQNSDIEGCVSLLLTPYRVKDDGTLDIFTEGRYSVLLDDVYKASADDNDLAQSLGTILFGIQSFITSKKL